MALLCAVLYFCGLWYLQWYVSFVNMLTSFQFATLVYGAYLGSRYLLRDSSIDWHAKLEELQANDPAANEVMHIILLPNYKENENMMMETLQVLSKSPMARTRTRVVLAMEAREGEGVKEKAERLVQKTSHLFADIFATYHPPDLPGEVAGKSSNTQWAYRAAMRRFEPIMLGCDFSRIFITVGDADTLWHPQYLSAVAYTGLTMSREERVWKIFQPPVILMRNMFSVPAPTKVTLYGHIMYELGHLGTQFFFPAFAYSAYTLTLALASGPEVDGWDVDVIAEDHHMFCKCYFANLWTQALDTEARKKYGLIHMRSKVKVVPIFLPVTGYLVESSDGHMASLHARFQQARRHAQGIAELGYIVLQYVRLWQSVGLRQLPARVHWGIWKAIAKLVLTHCVAPVQAFCMMSLAIIFLLPNIQWLVFEGVALQFFRDQVLTGTVTTWLLSQWREMDKSEQTLLSSLSQLLAIVPGFMTVSAWVVITAVIDGSYYNKLGQPDSSHSMDRVDEDDSDDANSGDAGAGKKLAVPAEPCWTVSAKGVPNIVTGPMTAGRRLYLLCMIGWEIMNYSYLVLWGFVMVPCFMAAWSLFRRGTAFEYIVAPKPTS